MLFAAVLAMSEYSYFVKMWLRATEMTCFVLWLSLPVDLLNWIDHPSHMSARRRQSKSGIHYLQNNKKKTRTVKEI